jgi:ferritin-like protein
MASDTYHEPLEQLSDYTRNMHRALQSLIEELEAIDWYQQRVDASSDEQLKAVIAHNRDEEIEHACMTLEWLRRNNPKFAQELKTYLYSEGPIEAVEDKIKQAEGGSSSDGSLGIGNLRGEE